MSLYEQVTKEERFKIEHYLQEGLKGTAIAKLIDRPKCTVYREINRNTKDWRHGYEHDKADETAKNRRKKKRSKLHQHQALQATVIEKLKSFWSPEMISGWLKLHYPKLYVCHETIYAFIYTSKIGIKEKLYHTLKHRKKRRIPFGSRKVRDSIIPNITSIHKRSMRANGRQEVGHWEADLILNKGGNILVLVERKTRFMMAYKNPSKHAHIILSKLNLALNTLPEKLKKSITFDRGTEFIRHQELSLAQHIKSFFCDPYSPWQKGAVENANGRLRRFIPKKLDINHLDQAMLDQIIDHMNNMPRKCLKYQTPKHKFYPYLKGCTSN